MIIFKVEKGGKTTISPIGYPGGECHQVTGHYRKYMAGATVSDVPTAEVLETERHQQTTSENKKETA